MEQMTITNLILILLPALAAVESGGEADPNACFGDNGQARGKWQIHASYLADANEYAGTSYTHEEMHCEWKARHTVIAYLLRWGKHYERETGKQVTLEVLARIHNGGPNGWKKKSTRKYWIKVKEQTDV